MSTRLQFTAILHRPDPDADELRPTCPKADCCPEAEFTEIPRAAYPAYGLCEDPVCFGREQR